MIHLQQLHLRAQLSLEANMSSLGKRSLKKGKKTNKQKCLAVRSKEKNTKAREQGTGGTSGNFAEILQGECHIRAGKIPEGNTTPKMEQDYPEGLQHE